MPLLSESELLAMRDTQADHMNDTCVIRAYGSTTDEFNMPKPKYTAGTPMTCGFRARSPREVLQRAQIATSDGDVRLPVGTLLDRRSRIRITHRHGQALNPVEDYEIIGEPLRGPSGLVVVVRRATDGE